MNANTILTLVKLDDVTGLETLAASNLIAPAIFKENDFTLRAKSKAMLYFLLDQGTNISLLDSDGNTLLHRCVCNEFIDYLLKRPLYRFNPNIKNSKGDPFLHRNRGYGLVLGSLQEHFSEPLDIDYQNATGMTLLHIYATHQTIALQKLFIFKPNPFLKNQNGQTPRQLANTPDAKALLEEYERTYISNTHIESQPLPRRVEVNMRELEEIAQKVDTSLIALKAGFDDMEARLNEIEKSVSHIKKHLHI